MCSVSLHFLEFSFFLWGLQAFQFSSFVASWLQSEIQFSKNNCADYLTASLLQLMGEAFFEVELEFVEWSMNIVINKCSKFSLLLSIGFYLSLFVSSWTVTNLFVETFAVPKVLWILAWIIICFKLFICYLLFATYSHFKKCRLFSPGVERIPCGFKWSISQHRLLFVLP